MLTLILSLVFGIQVYDSGSTVHVDTATACLTMFELRAATEKLEVCTVTDSLVLEYQARHAADSASYDQLGKAYTAIKRAKDTTTYALKVSDSTRKACVVQAGVIEKNASRQFFVGLGVGSGVGVVLAAVAFFFGLMTGS
jgi:hypothetical protein